MPHTFDSEAAKRQQFLDISRPDEEVPRDPNTGTIREGWAGTMSRGLPVKLIPHFDFPLVVYKHPLKPFRAIEHRNNNFELVGTEEIPTEHLTKKICCDAHKNGGPKECADCKKALEAALAKGWRKEPYIPVAPPTVEDDIYGKDDEDSPSLPPAPARSTRGTAENPL